MIDPEYKDYWNLWGLGAAFVGGSMVGFMYRVVVLLDRLVEVMERKL